MNSGIGTHCPGICGLQGLKLTDHKVLEIQISVKLGRKWKECRDARNIGSSVLFMKRVSSLGEGTRLLVASS